MGEVDTEEKRELEAKIVDLTATLEEKTGIQTMLTAQLKRLQVCMLHFSYVTSYFS